MSNTIDWNKVAKGTKFEMLVNRAEYARKGDVVTFGYLDDYNDPWFTATDGKNFYMTGGTAHKRVKKVETLLDGAWIAWNSWGSVLAASEEEAKKKAEEILDHFDDQPVYIAQATAYVVKQDKVWH